MRKMSSCGPVRKEGSWSRWPREQPSNGSSHGRDRMTASDIGVTNIFASVGEGGTLGLCWMRSRRHRRKMELVGCQTRRSAQRGDNQPWPLIPAAARLTGCRARETCGGADPAETVLGRHSSFLYDDDWPFLFLLGHNRSRRQDCTGWAGWATLRSLRYWSVKLRAG
jgi:hypothetical protein